MGITGLGAAELLREFNPKKYELQIKDNTGEQPDVVKDALRNAINFRGQDGPSTGRVPYGSQDQRRGQSDKQFADYIATDGVVLSVLYNRIDSSRDANGDETQGEGEGRKRRRKRK